MAVVGPLRYVGLMIVWLLLTSIAVGLRLYVRARITRSWGQDDWMLLGAQIAFIAHMCIYFAACAIFPQDEASVTPSTYRKINSLWFWATMAYTASQVSLKASTALFFATLARHPWQKRLCLWPTYLFLFYSTIVGLFLVFRCGAPSPVGLMTRTDCAVNWSVIGPLLILFIAFNAIIDWLFAVTPIWLVLRARKLDPRSRRLVWGLILLAMAGSVVSVVRLPYLKNYEFGPDLWKRTVPFSLVSASESAIGFIAISVATLKPLMKPLRRAYRKVFGMTTEASDLSGPKTPRRQRTETTGGQPTTMSIDPSLFHGVGILPDSTMQSRDADTISSGSYGLSSSTTSGTGTTGSVMYSVKAGHQLVSIQEVDAHESDHVGFDGDDDIEMQRRPRDSI